LCRCLRLDLSEVLHIVGGIDMFQHKMPKASILLCEVSYSRETAPVVCKNARYSFAIALSNSTVIAIPI